MTFLEKLREKNVKRCNEVFHLFEEWEPWDWSNAMAGEAGEVCNFTKKLRRGDAVLFSSIEDEIADVIIYADLLAASLKIDLKKAITNKFNSVSRKRSSNILI